MTWNLRIRALPNISLLRMFEMPEMRVRHNRAATSVLLSPGLGPNPASKAQRYIVMSYGKFSRKGLSILRNASFRQRPRVTPTRSGLKLIAKLEVCLQISSLTLTCIIADSNRASETKPFLTSSQVRRHTMPHTRRIDALNIRTVIVCLVIRLWVVLNRRSGRLTDAEDIRPLLQCSGSEIMLHF